MNEKLYNRRLGKYFRKPENLKLILLSTLRSIGKRKVFCVGRPKTGTTSMKKAFDELGLVVGNQLLGELLLLDWAKRDFRRIYLLCCTGQAFQDIPFSLPYTFQALDQRFPGSKFILTVRNSPQQWYQSLTRFHAKLYGNGQIPTSEDLKAARYIFKGRPHLGNRLTYHAPPGDPYNKDVLITHYKAHNKAVMDYFKHRKDDLLVLNIAGNGAYDKLCDFLGKPRVGRPFPHENKTKDVSVRKPKTN